jgi:hypothetical protein
MKTRIYQICYSQETLESIPAGFLPLNNVVNERSDWRELWPIRNYLKTNILSDDTLYGFLSPKFFQKTHLNFEGLQNYLKENYSNQDLVSFSPFWDLMAIFKNVFEQGDFFHPGLADVCAKFCASSIPHLNLADTVMDSQNTIFCNYFLAKKEFWRQWLILADQLFEAAENKNTDLGNQLNDSTNYGTQQLPMKVFVQERLASICLLANNNFKCLNYSPFNTGPSITPFNQFLSESVKSDALKRAFIQTGHVCYLNEFSELRNKIIHSLQCQSIK